MLWWNSVFRRRSQMRSSLTAAQTSKKFWAYPFVYIYICVFDLLMIESEVKIEIHVCQSTDLVTVWCYLESRQVLIAFNLFNNLNNHLIFILIDFYIVCITMGFVLWETKVGVLSCFCFCSSLFWGIWWISCFNG